LNVASALIKQVLTLQDFETWSYVRKHYLPKEYHTIFSVIDKHCDSYHKLPSVEELKLSTRDTSTLDKIYAIETLEVDTDPYILLQYLKNEFTQREILTELDDYVENSISFEDAEESVQHLHDIILRVEDKVELEEPQESMQRISLFEDEEEQGNPLPVLILQTPYIKMVSLHCTLLSKWTPGLFSRDFALLLQRCRKGAYGLKISV